MAGATTTTVTSVLKQVYLPPIQDQFNKAKVLLKKIKRASKKDVVNNKAIIPLATARHQGHGSRAEDATLPGAGNVAYTTMTPPLRYQYAVVRITGPAIEAAKTDRMSFVRTLDSEIKGAEEGFLRSVNRQLFGLGTGILTVCGTTSSSTTVNVNNTRYLEVGQTIDIKDITSNSSITDSYTITEGDIDATNNTLTVSAAVSTNSTDGVYLEDARNIDIMGLEGIVDDRDPDDIILPGGKTGVSNGFGALQGLSVASASYWKATRDHNSGTNRAITVRLLQQTIENIDLSSGLGSSLDMIISRHGQFREYGLLLVPDKRYGPSPNKMDGGFKFLEFDGIPWYFDRDCPPNKVFFLNTSVLRLYENAPIQWADRDGAVLYRDSNKDAWNAWMYWYVEMGVTKRFALGKLEDLSE